MQKCIVGKKIGMTQLFDENGKVIPVTVVEAGPCVVVQKKTIENDGYEAVQIGYGDISDKAINKPLKVAVMGCVVNGPGEARFADVGVACGREEGLLFARGEKLRRVPADSIVDELFALIETL